MGEPKWTRAEVRSLAKLSAAVLSSWQEMCDLDYADLFDVLEDCGLIGSSIVTAADMNEDWCADAGLIEGDPCFRTTSLARKLLGMSDV